MMIQEPTLEVVEINMEDIVTASNCATTASQSKPSVQTCSSGAVQDENCSDPTINW